MAKGPKITEAIKNAILILKATNHNWSANQVRNRLRKELHLNEKQTPKIRAVQYIIAKNRLGLEKTKAGVQEKPWSVGSLEDFQLPPDSVAVLLEIQNKRPELKLPPLTIRQAKWAARLFPTIIYLCEGKETSTTTDMVNYWSSRYAFFEEACEITNSDFYTLFLDQALFESRAEIKKGIKLINEKSGGPWVYLGKLEIKIKTTI